LITRDLGLNSYTKFSMEQYSDKQIPNYFQEVNPHQWSLIDFLEWRSENLILRDRNQEHGKLFFLVIGTVDGPKACPSPLESIAVTHWCVLLSHPVLNPLEFVADIKCSPEVVKFWNDRNTQNLREKIQHVKAHNELKLFQIESEDLKYALDRSKNLNFTTIENKRKEALEKSDGDFQPMKTSSTKRKKQSSLSIKNEESANLTASKKVKITDEGNAEMNDTGDPTASNSQPSESIGTQRSSREVNDVNTRNDRLSISGNK
ncbi:16374_t:CDS:2, partial [Funneliformis caledonium]